MENARDCFPKPENLFGQTHTFVRDHQKVKFLTCQVECIQVGQKFKCNVYVSFQTPSVSLLAPQLDLLGTESITAKADG